MKKIFLSCGGIVLLFFLLRAVSNIFWPLVDPTEGRYAETAVEMARSGDFVTPYVWIRGNLVPFLGKPPLYFQIDALFVKCFGVNEFAVRFGSLFGGLLTILFTFVLTRRFFDAQTAKNSVMALCACGLFFALSGAVGVDAVLTAWITLAYLAYFAWLKEERFWPSKLYSVIVFAALGLGFMTKGPVAIATFGMPVLLWHIIFGQWKKLLRHAWIGGGVLFLAITLPWFLAIEKASGSCGNVDFVRYFFLEENFHRFTTTAYVDMYGNGHVQIFGMALVFMLCCALPWVLFVPQFFVKRPAAERQWHLRKNILYQNDTEAYFFFIFAVNTIFWCFASQYMVTYFMPFTAAFCIYFVLLAKQRFEWVYRYIPHIALIMLGGLFLFYVVSGLIFPYTQNKQKFHEVYRQIEAYEAQNVITQPYKVAVYERRNHCTPYFYGLPTGRLMVEPDTVYVNFKKPDMMLKARSYMPMSQDPLLPHALRMYDEADSVLVVVTQLQLRKYFTPDTGIKFAWRDLQQYKNITLTPDGKRLIIAPSDHPMRWDILFQVGDYAVLRPRGYWKSAEK